MIYENVKNLVLLDDIGLKSYTLEESRDILEIVERRYDKVSTIYPEKKRGDGLVRE